MRYGMPLLGVLLLAAGAAAGQSAGCIDPGAAGTGTLTTIGVPGCAAGVLPATSEGLLVAVTFPPDAGHLLAEASVDAEVGTELCLLDASRTRLQCRYGTRTARLPDLAPPPGDYLLHLRQHGDEELPFRLELSDSPSSLDEQEPNDGWSQASPLQDGEASGRVWGDETDYFLLEVTGQPKLWRIEVEGSGLRGLGYLDGSGREVMQRAASSSGDSASISNIFLLPGRHYIFVRGENGEYRVCAGPLAAPSDTSEREANDDKTRALPLAFDQERSGHLDRFDKDIYRFSLYAREHVRVEVTPSPEVSLRLSLGEYVADYGLAPGEPIVHERLLLPGDHYVEIMANGDTAGAYSVALTPLDPLALPADVEPNNQAYQARPLPPSGLIEGRLAADDPYDWYLLPPQDRPGRLRLLIEGGVDVYFHGFEGDSRDQLARLPQAEGEFQVELPAAQDLRLQVSGQAEYRIAFDRELASVEPETPVRVELAPPEAPVAAYWHEGQRLESAVLLSNDGERAQTVELEAVSSHYNWRPVLPQEPVTLAPGESRRVPLEVEVLPDARDDLPVRVTVQALADGGFRSTATMQVEAGCGVPPVAPEALWPVPGPLLGGTNLAWAGMGGSVVGDGGGQASLIDGLVAPSTGWTARVGASVTILLGNDDAPLAGVLINPYSNRDPAERLADFELQASSDGESFEPVLRARLSPAPVEQAFVFPQPVVASHLRLVAHSNQRGDQGVVSLGEMKVVAAPRVDIFGGKGANLSDPATGGYVVWSRPSFPYGQGMFGPAAEPRDLYLEEAETQIEWALGFHNDRAGRLAALEWVAAPREPQRQAIETVEIAVSSTSPVGPWTELGVWEVARQPLFTLEGQPWARFVRLRALGLEGGRSYGLPLDVRVHEAPVTGEYLTILGEWGQSRRNAIYEALEPVEPSVALAEDDDNDSRERAQLLVSEEPVAGRVVIGEDVDWYRVTVPQGDNSLELSLAGEPVLAVRYELLNDRGEQVPFDVSGSPSRVTLSAFVEPGEYYLRLEEPPRSVVFAWDNSGSMGEYLDIIYQTISAFVSEVQPGREAAQLLAFEEDAWGAFLLPEWSDDPSELMAALNDYDRSAGSSNSEANLLAATRALGERQGTRAVMFMTDAESNGQGLAAELWTELERVRPRVFTFETSSAGSTHTQDLMQSWAGVAGGYYDYARGVGDFEAGFRRATCHLRRPAYYRLEVATRYRQPPGPGLLSVVREAGVADNPPVEIILDLSGSMAKALPQGPSRVEVAKRVLNELIGEVLPEGTPFALRIFGHVRPNSCDTRLELRLAPLDRAAAQRAVALAQPQLLSGTPLATSLLEVARDLEGRTGGTVILLTDGEESCDGDVEGAVRTLNEAGMDVQLHIISFDVESAEAKEAFERWAQLGGGRFFGADDGAGLAAALRSALAPTFQVVDGTGTVVASGTVGGDPVSLPPGIYQVRLLGPGAITLEEVRVRGDDEQQLVLGASGP